MTQIEDARGKDDWEQLSRLAHFLKGSAGCIGAYDLQKTAFALETAAKENKNPPVLVSLIDSVTKELDRVYDSINGI
ncbi:Hpt domain-containing protein [bacterium]|nr:Hpt domain-containing protein [bacterium]